MTRWQQLQKENNPAVGFGYVLQGFKLVLQPKLRAYVLIPLLINILIFIALLWFAINQFDGLLGSYLPDEGLPFWLPDWEWLTTLEPIFAVFRWFFWGIFALAFLLIFIYSFTLIANILSAPFNEVLAEKVEVYLTGEKPEGANNSFIGAFGPSIKSELFKAGYFILRSIPLLILFLIPGINLAAPFIWGLFSIWMLANEYLEYPFGLNNIWFKEQRQFLKKRRWATLGFGFGVMLIMAIPILNLAAMPVAVAGATAWWVEKLKPYYLSQTNIHTTTLQQ